MVASAFGFAQPHHALGHPTGHRVVQQLAGLAWVEQLLGAEVVGGRLYRAAKGLDLLRGGGEQFFAAVGLIRSPTAPKTVGMALSSFR